MFKHLVAVFLVSRCVRTLCVSILFLQCVYVCSIGVLLSGVFTRNVFMCFCGVFTCSMLIFRSDCLFPHPVLANSKVYYYVPLNTL